MAFTDTQVPGKYRHVPLATGFRERMVRVVEQFPMPGGVAVESFGQRIAQPQGHGRRILHRGELSGEFGTRCSPQLCQRHYAIHQIGRRQPAQQWTEAARANAGHRARRYVRLGPVVDRSCLWAEHDDIGAAPGDAADHDRPGHLWRVDVNPAAVGPQSRDIDIPGAAHMPTVIVISAAGTAETSNTRSESAQHSGVMILVTGATGTVGRPLLELLSARGEPVRAMVRNPAAAVVPPAVEVVRGDFDAPASLPGALAGVSAAFLLTAPSTPTGDHDAVFVSAARRAGVERIVKLSAIGTGAVTPEGEVIGSQHADGERVLREAGADWTILRPSVFATNTLSWADAIRHGRPVANLTGAGRQGVIHPRDIASVAVTALTTDGHTGRVYTLTGPESLSVPEQVTILGEVLGRTVAHTDIDPGTIRAQLAGSGMTDAAVRIMVNGLSYARSGRNDAVTSDVYSVTGRSPITYRAWAEEHRTWFGTQARGGSDAVRS